MNDQRISLQEMIAWAKRQHLRMVYEWNLARTKESARDLDVAAAVVRTLEALSKDRT